MGHSHNKKKKEKKPFIYNGKYLSLVETISKVSGRLWAKYIVLMCTLWSNKLCSELSITYQRVFSNGVSSSIDQWTAVVYAVLTLWAHISHSFIISDSLRNSRATNCGLHFVNSLHFIHHAKVSHSCWVLAVWSNMFT